LAEAGSQMKQRKMGMLSSLKTGYEDIVKAIIRPPRARYGLQELGSAEFQIRGRNFRREDVQVRNSRGLLLEGSWWQPVEYGREQLPCVVCMHGNSSCRLDALEILPLVLNMGITLFGFDFAGCGRSEGEFITLGYHEKDDAAKIVEYLRASSRVSTIAFWGRSMGAASALLHGHRDPSIAAMVLDSPFASLEQVTRELIDSAQIKHKPGVIINAVLKMLRKTIRKRTGMDILRLRPIENVDTCFIPALFVAGKDDQFVRPHHSQEIHDRYAGDKNLVLVEGDHNSDRPRYFRDSAAIFIYNRVCVPAGLTEEALGLRPSMDTPSPVRAFDADAEDDGQLQQALLMSLATT
jgi:pimeloyl-ACP methyl ester carboxylesterase